MRYLLLLILLVGCSKPSVVPMQHIKSVQYRSYPISDSEHVLLIDVPDRFVDRRCMAYVNTETKTTNLNCNFDETTEMPE